MEDSCSRVARGQKESATGGADNMRRGQREERTTGREDNGKRGQRRERRRGGADSRRSGQHEGQQEEWSATRADNKKGSIYI